MSDALPETCHPLRTAAWEIIGQASELTGLDAWRITQQVYRFDPDLYAALLATPIVGKIPGEHFRRLPARWVYVETLGLDTDAQLAVGHVPLIGTLDASLAQVEADWQDGVAASVSGGAPPEGYAQAAKRAFAPMLSLRLYLCVEDAD